MDEIHELGGLCDWNLLQVLNHDPSDGVFHDFEILRDLLLRIVTVKCFLLVKVAQSAIVITELRDVVSETTLRASSLGVVVEVRQEVSDLFIVNLKIADSYSIGEIILSLKHLEKQVLNGQIAKTQIHEFVQSLLICFLLAILLHLALHFDRLIFKLTKHRVGLAGARHPICETRNIIAIQQLRNQGL